MSKCFKILASVFFFTSFAQGQPYKEIYAIKEIESSLTEESFVVFDLDLTLIHPDGTLASPKAFEAQMKKVLEVGDAEREISMSRLISEYNASLALTNFTLIEQDTAAFLLSLVEDRNCETLGLTARGFQAVSSTQIHLQTHDIQFSNRMESLFEKEFFQSADFREPILMSRGVVFASGQHKGSVLKHVLDAKGHSPKHIVFVDDTVKNINQMHQACIEHNWSCSLFLYQRMDKWVEACDVSNITEQRDSAKSIMNSFWM